MIILFMEKESKNFGEKIAKDVAGLPTTVLMNEDNKKTDNMNTVNTSSDTIKKEVTERTIEEKLKDNEEKLPE